MLTTIHPTVPMRLVSYGGDDLEEDEDENESSEESQDEDSDRKDNNDTVSIHAIFPVFVQHFMSAVYVLQMFDKILEEHTTSRQYLERLKSHLLFSSVKHFFKFCAPKMYTRDI